MPTKNYREILDLLHISIREIGRRADVSYMTVINVIDKKDKPIGYSKETAEKVHKVIDDEVKRVQRGLERLSGGALQQS